MTQCTLVECCVRIYRVDGPLSLKLEKKVFPYRNFALFTSTDCLSWPITHIHTELSDRKFRDQPHT